MRKGQIKYEKEEDETKFTCSDRSLRIHKKLETTIINCEISCHGFIRWKNDN